MISVTSLLWPWKTSEWGVREKPERDNVPLRTSQQPLHLRSSYRIEHRHILERNSLWRRQRNVSDRCCLCLIPLLFASHFYNQSLFLIKAQHHPCVAMETISSPMLVKTNQTTSKSVKQNGRTSLNSWESSHSDNRSQICNFIPKETRNLARDINHSLNISLTFNYW